MLEFRSGGRRVSQDEFFENLKNEAIEAGMRQLEGEGPRRRSSIRKPASMLKSSSAAAARQS